MSLRLLLDTHALIWTLSDPRRLPTRVAKLLRHPENDVYVSAVATWEISIKAALGKIRTDITDLMHAAYAAGLDELPVTIAHTVRLRTLPSLHRDPFDRLTASISRPRASRPLA